MHNGAPVRMIYIINPQRSRTMTAGGPSNCLLYQDNRAGSGVRAYCIYYVVGPRTKQTRENSRTTESSGKRFSLSVEAPLLGAAEVLDVVVQGQDVAGGVRTVPPGEAVAVIKNNENRLINVHGTRERAKAKRLGGGFRVEKKKPCAPQVHKVFRYYYYCCTVSAKYLE